MTRIAVVGHVEWVDFVEVDRFPQPGTVVHAPGSFARAAGEAAWSRGSSLSGGPEVDFFVALGRDAQDGDGRAIDGPRGRAARGLARAPTRRAVTLLEPSGERTIMTLGGRLEPFGSDDLTGDASPNVAGVYFTAGDAWRPGARARPGCRGVAESAASLRKRRIPMSTRSSSARATDDERRGRSGPRAGPACCWRRRATRRTLVG